MQLTRSGPVPGQAFGNAKTSRNNNSSRFGKYLKIIVSAEGAVLGAATRQYLLEKSRVPFQAAGERNYHVFYDLLAAALPEHALGTSPAAFWYLQQSGTYTVPGLDDKEEYATLHAAFGAVGVSAAEVAHVLSLVAGILHLGNVNFEGEDHATVEPGDSAAALERARALLSLPTIERCLTARSVRAHGEVISVDLTEEKAELARDALAKAAYTLLFEWIVDQINDGMRAAQEEQAGFLGLLDVFGFESFKANSFEQLCINFANEKLQQVAPPPPSLPHCPLITSPPCCLSTALRAAIRYFPSLPALFANVR